MVHKIPVYTQSAHVFQLGRVLCRVSSFPMPPLTWRETKKQRQTMTFGSRREGHKSVFRVSSSLPSLPRKMNLLQVREAHVMCSSVLQQSFDTLLFPVLCAGVAPGLSYLRHHFVLLITHTSFSKSS